MQNSIRKWLNKHLFFICIVNVFFAFSVNAADELQSGPIKIGMSVPLTGTAKGLGEGMKVGVKTYFDRVNAEGGIGGRKLELIVLDDGYEPIRAAQNIRKLIDKDHVLATIGNVGTPTATLTVPIANEKKNLLFGAFTGSNILRKMPPDRYVINLRASYQEEVSEMIKNLLALGIKPEELAFFTQNDSYGDSGYQAAMKALKEAGYSNPETLPYGRYERNTVNVEDGFAEILADVKTPKAFILVGTYAPIAKFIGLAKKEFPDALFLNVSFVGSKPLAMELKNDTTNVIVMQVVPPLNSDLSGVADYRKDLKKYNPEATESFISLEGYLAARLFTVGLRQAEKDGKLTTEGIVDSFESMRNVDIGIGININLDKNKHQALHVVWPTIFRNGDFEILDWSILKK